MKKKRIGPIRHSERTAFKQCPRKLYWSKVAGIERISQGAYFAIGSAYHKGLEIWRSGADVQEAFDGACDYLREHLKAATPEALEDECARVKAYVMGYTVKYADDRSHEWKFEHTIKKPQNTGTIDAWMRDAGGSVWIVDDKTRAQLTSDLHLVVRMDEQLFNYALLLEEAKVLPVAGAVIRETKKAGIKRTKKETGDDYASRVMALYKDGNSELYREEKVTFTPESLDRYKQMRLFENERIKANCSKASTFADWPYNYNACVGKYGNCEYLEACTGAGSDKIYQPKKEGALDDGQGCKEVFGYEATRDTGDATASTPAGVSGSLSSAPI